MEKELLMEWEGLSSVLQTQQSKEAVTLYNFLKDKPSSIKYFWIFEEAIVKYNESFPKNVPAVKGENPSSDH